MPSFDVRSVPPIAYIPPATVQPDGSFEVTDIVPNTYSLFVAGPGVGESGWWPRAAMLAGTDLLDAPIQIAAGDAVSGVTITLSDRRTELSGTLEAPNGTPVSDVLILAYPANPALRTPRSRRVQAVRPDSAGKFILTNLPPGDYLLCALANADGTEWADPAFFGQLVSSSVKVTLGEGEKKVQNLRLGPPSEQIQHR